METNPYEYDRTSEGTPQQNQLFQYRPAAAQNGQQSVQSHNQKLPGQKPGTRAKMPKAQALALVNALKRTLAVASIIGFGIFGGLVAMHQVSTTTQSTSGSSNTSSNSNSSSQNSNSFFNQQGGNTSGTSSTSSTPVTGTTIS